MSASAPSMDEGLLGRGTHVGEYEIERLLGVGGMGEVYGARQQVIGKQVAIEVTGAGPGGRRRRRGAADAVGSAAGER